MPRQRHGVVDMLQHVQRQQLVARLGRLMVLEQRVRYVHAGVPFAHQRGEAARALDDLVVVGAMMMAQIREIKFTKFAIALPAFLTIVTMPLTYSIANGIGVGFISFAVVNAASGKAKKVHPLMWVVTAGFVIYFARGPINALMGI